MTRGFFGRRKRGEGRRGGAIRDGGRGGRRGDGPVGWIRFFNGRRLKTGQRRKNREKGIEIESWRARRGYWPGAKRPVERHRRFEKLEAGANGFPEGFPDESYRRKEPLFATILRALRGFVRRGRTDRDPLREGAVLRGV